MHRVALRSIAQSAHLGARAREERPMPKELTPRQKERQLEAQQLLDDARAKGHLNPLQPPKNSPNALDPKRVRGINQGYLSAAMQPHHTIGDLKATLRSVKDMVGAGEAESLYEAARSGARARGVNAPALKDLDSADETQPVPYGGGPK
jgi:hypothetical protein